MRYDDFRRSADIEDRRDDSGGGFGGGGGGIGLPMGGGGLGIGTILVLGVIGYALGIDPRILIGGAEILSNGGSSSQYQSDNSSSARPTGVPKDQMGDFVSGVLGEIDDRWTEVFSASGRNFVGPKVVLFRNVTNGGRCGRAESAMGPFYCPPEQKIFLDTGFFREVETRFRGCTGKACQFTQAYIIAHEAGHHVQNLLGIIPEGDRDAAAGLQQDRSQRAASPRRTAGRLSRRRLGQPGKAEAAELPRGG